MRGSASSRPVVELPFAGHPVLGTAFVLGGPLQVEVIRLETGAGLVPVRLEREGARDRLRPDGTAAARRSSRSSAGELLAALGVERSELPVELYDNGLPHVYVGSAREEDVAALRPDLDALAELPRALGVNCFAGAGTRWKTRMFAPADGVPRTRRPAPRPARSPSTSSATAGSLRRRDRDLSGRRDRPPVDALRPRRGHRRADRAVEVGGCAVIVARGEFSF